MNYYEMRERISKAVPRMTRFKIETHERRNKEKGRKVNYHQFDLFTGEAAKRERLLNQREVNSFLEISCRAAACPMPMNLDVWDGLRCPFKCKYCFADNFRHSLYTSFFDNAKTMRLRHCNPDFYEREMDALFEKFRGQRSGDTTNDLGKAISLEMPVRFGIRFEDFCPDEGKEKISLHLLRYLAEQAYPVMINSKSDLLGREDYVEALAGNRGKAAIHLTMISSNDSILKRLEPGAPPFQQRIEACRALSQAGVRVVARLEPFLPFICDDPKDVQEYIQALKYAGIEHITFDTYSYSAKSPDIRAAFLGLKIDWDRIFLCGADSQPIGSLLLDSFMDIFREAGFKCGTFDMGCVPSNEQFVCCQVGDWFDNSGFNRGCTVGAVWFLKENEGIPKGWEDFENWVEEGGGFLSPTLKMEVRERWNFEGGNAYSHAWGRGIEMVGWDKNGAIFVYNEKADFRNEILKGCFLENQ